MADCFYEPLDDTGARWRATDATCGPWDARAQHGSPPSALLARAMEREQPREDMRIGRVTVEILGQVPVGELDLRVRMVRPGRSVAMVEAALSAGGRDVARASAWRVRRTEGVTVQGTLRTPAPVPPPVTARPYGGSWGGGYLDAVEWRTVAGSFDEPGPATAWTRLRGTVVADEDPSPLQRLMAVADCGNGLSASLDLTRYWFINPELSVHTARDVEGEWVCLDAQTLVSDGGSGLATTVLSDQHGPVGVGAQTLLVGLRPDAAQA